ncbi:MAG: hypothetical protein HY646_22135 [Acidobacteria bacterium]|nr:hypothetical protein [Acidobacteriota bacterium]
MSILLSFLMMLIPQVKLENGRFNIIQDGKRIGTEEFSITTRGTGYTAEGRIRITSGRETTEVRSRMELDSQLRPTYYEQQSKQGVIRLRIAQPLSELEYSVGGREQQHDIRFPENGAILDDNFFHHYLILLYRPGISGAIVPTLVPTSGTMGTLAIRQSADHTYELQTENNRLIATTDSDGRLIRLTAPDANVVVER